MSKLEPKSKREMPLAQMLPNLVTLAAICAGLSAIRYGYQGHFQLATFLILVAILLDGFDGRLARALNSQSALGAELDSLADFLNFGVAPPLILYAWGLQELPRAGWIAVLIFAVCCVLRLARFNVGIKEQGDSSGDRFFTGVPAPAGALLVLLPMFLDFATEDENKLSFWFIAIYLVGVGLLMYSRIPTFSLKSLSIRGDYARYYMLGFVVLIAALLTYLWATLVVLDIAYLASIAWSWHSARKI